MFKRFSIVFFVLLFLLTVIMYTLFGIDVAFNTAFVYTTTYIIFVFAVKIGRWILNE